MGYLFGLLVCLFCCTNLFGLCLLVGLVCFVMFTRFDLMSAVGVVYVDWLVGGGCLHWLWFIVIVMVSGC